MIDLTVLLYICLMSTLFLIPVPIALDALQSLPAETVEVARGLDLFVVERSKTARQFLKSIAVNKAMSDITVLEIDEKDISVVEVALKSAYREGRSVGVLSEAGCPGVADPGASVVTIAHQIGMRVRPLVGPSSLLLALMASGMNGQRFTFHGYLSPKRPELMRDLQRLEQQAERRKETQLFIETPYRSQMVLEVALDALRPDTRFCVAQDLTGAGEKVISKKVKDWKTAGAPVLEKAPAVFIVYRD
jgi:16S rRNA (cytidine1402-2'-O)-methyltransferase